MKNLILSDLRSFSTGVKDGKLIAVNTLNEYIYIATPFEITEYNTNEKQALNFVSLIDHGYLDKKSQENIISIDYLLDQEQLCVATSKGDLLLWQPEMNVLENVGCVDAGFTCANWSPDQELLVLCTGSDTLILMTNDFDPICEHPLHTDEFGEARLWKLKAKFLDLNDFDPICEHLQFGEAEPINVGWGKKETQFHGSEGKGAAQVKKPDKSTPILHSDDSRTEVSWRGDGQLFAITSVNPNDGCRYVRIYDREGKLQATNEFIESMEHCISWRPSGNLIVCSQQKPNKHDVIFLEKNGLQHGEFTLPSPKGEKLIISMLWNSSSDILTIVSKELKEENKYTVQLWTTGNYHWYLKQEMHFECEKSTNQQPCVYWDPESSYMLHIMLPDGTYSQYTYIYDIVQSKGGDNLAMVAVVDGANLLLTPFKLIVLPPPMATHTIKMPASILQVAFMSGETMHDVVVSLSSKQFVLVKYNCSTKTYEKHAEPMWTESIQELQLRHLTYWKEQKMAAIYTTVDNEDCIAILDFTQNKLHLETSIKLDMENEKALKLFKNEDLPSSLLLYGKSGTVYTIDDSNGSQHATLSTEKNLSMPLLCSHVAVKDILGKSYVFGLSSHFRLQMNHHEIARDCTSFFIHDEFLLLTTHTHTLRCIYLNSLVQNPVKSESFTYDEAVRRVERGSKIVTSVRDGTAVILQMPRGNLECINPRALVVTHLQKLLSNLKYGEALEIMRRNRINLNLLADHDQQLFLRNAKRFIEDVDSVNRINLFLADLSPEDVCTTLYFPFYHHGQEKEKSSRVKFPQDKVDIICKAVREAILQLENKDKFLLSLLTTYAKETKPDLESVLLKIKDLKDNPLTAGEDGVTYEKALSHILYLVDVNQLFDIALGLYEFQVVLMVAEKSQKDPKEYLPFLNNFKNMEENYKKYSIDKYLKRFKKALKHIVKCEDRFNECLEFIKEHNLFQEALILFQKGSDHFKKISFEYGHHLHNNKIYEEAAIVFSRSGFHEEALESSKHTCNWNMTFLEAKQLGYTEQQLVALCRNRSHKLKSYRMFAEAAYLLETYAKDIEESVVCLIEGALWFQALHVIHRHEREDLTETNLKPAVMESYDQLSDKLCDMKETFIKHTDRLQIVVEKKKREDLEILEGIRDDPQNELYSDTSSITGQSAISASSKGSRSSGHSRKSKTKTERKKYSLREGSKHEDFALREALAEIVLGADKMKEEISSLLKILMFYFYEDQARNLQSVFDELLHVIETNKAEIWVAQSKDVEAGTFEYGPGATVQQILEKKNNAANTSSMTKKNSDIPEPTKPTMRSNVKWRLNVLGTI